jgi:hypothetical protein
MSTIDQGLVGRTLMGIDGHKIGRIDAIYVNSSTGEPEWVAIDLGGLLATKHGFAPVAMVSSEGQNALVEYETKFVKHAPTTKSEGVLSPAENEALYGYYGIPRDQREPSGSRNAALFARN